MAIDPPLTQLFGSGATQTETQVSISKAALPGLTAGETNTAEGLAVGLLKRWALGQDASTDAQVTVRIQPPNVVQRGGQSMSLYRFIVDTYEPYTGPTEPDPDNF